MRGTIVRKILLAMLVLGLISISARRSDAQKKWWEHPQPRFAKTDLGRVFSGTIDLRDSGRQSTRKALAIRIGESLEADSSATILFDTELMQFSAAIPDRFVMFSTYRDGLGGAGHWVGAPYIFTARREPGWASEAKFDDPRPKKNGPLPREWSKYLGMYRHGPRAVLSYTVGYSSVLDAPLLEGRGDMRAVTRTIEIGAAKHAMLLKVCDTEGTTGEVQTADGRSWLLLEKNEKLTAIGIVTDSTSRDKVRLLISDTGRVLAEVSPRGGTARLKLLVFSGEKEAAPKFVAALKQSKAPKDLSTLTKPGPPQWPKPVVTKGQLGAGDGPYVVDTLAAPYENPHRALMRFGGHDFFKNGDAAICTIDGDVWRVSGLDGDLLNISWKRYATGLFQPLGLRIVDNKVYVLGRDQITRLHDSNGDHEADFYECFNNDCKIGRHVHEYTVCLETDPAGNFYYVKGNNGGQSVHDGSMFRISKDGKKSDIFATGFRWPNGGGAGPDGTVTVADQQGNWIPSSRLDIITPGGFYGYMPAHHRDQKPEKYDGPLCWIPHSIDNSCGGQAWIGGDRWGLASGKMLHLSYGKCSMFLVVQDQVGDVRQGGVIPFGLRFASGAMRGRFREKDGQFYISGLRGWQTSAGNDGCFQRVRYTGKPVHMPTELKVHKNGILISFSKPVDRKTAGNWENWGIQQWNYRWTGAYGSKDYKVSDPRKTGHDELEVDDVYVATDGKTVFLEVADLQPVMQMKIQYNIATDQGAKLSNAIYNTIHVLRPEIDPKTVGEQVE
jgi:hypothetical protein